MRVTQEQVKRRAQLEHKASIRRFVTNLIRAKLEDIDETTVDQTDGPANEKGSGVHDVRDDSSNKKINPVPATQVQSLDQEGSTEKGHIGEKVKRFKVATEAARGRTVKFLKESGYRIVAERDRSGNILAVWRKTAKEGMDPDTADTKKSIVNQDVATQSPKDAGQSHEVDQGEAKHPDMEPSFDGVPGMLTKTSAWDEPDLVANGNTASGGGATSKGGGGSYTEASDGEEIGGERGGAYYVRSPEDAGAGGPFEDELQAQDKVLAAPGETAKAMSSMQSEDDSYQYENTGSGLANGDWVYVYNKSDNRKVDSGTVMKFERGSGTTRITLIGGTEYDVANYKVIKMA